MTEPRAGTSRAGLTAGYLIIAAAMAILISYYLEVWWYFFPVMMIAGGLYLLLMAGLSGRTAAGGGRPLVYLLLWGGVLAIIGGEWIVNDLYPGNVVFLVVVFLVFIGSIAILGYWLRARG